MKRIILLVMAAVMTITASAQQHNCDCTKNIIEVVGVSEESITPDTFYISITIDEGDSKGRISATKQQEKLIDELEKMGINISEQLKVNSMSSAFEKRSKAYTKLSYTLKITNLEQLNAVQELLDDLYISNAHLARVESSRMNEARSRARTAAVKNAKETAAELAAALGQNMGKCISINDLSNDNLPYYSVNSMRLFSRAADSSEGIERTPVEIKDIKISYRVRVLFYLY